MSANSEKKFYALNMFDVTDLEKYVEYFRRCPKRHQSMVAGWWRSAVSGIT